MDSGSELEAKIKGELECEYRNVNELECQHEYDNEESDDFIFEQDNLHYELNDEELELETDYLFEGADISVKDLALILLTLCK